MAGICDLVLGRDQEIVYWVQSQLKMPELIVPATGIGFAHDGEIIGGAIYFNHRKDSPSDVEFGIATISPHWATRKTLRAMFSYPFEVLECDRMSAFIHKANHKSIDRAERLGFVREGHKRPDYYLYGMLKTECYWL